MKRRDVLRQAGALALGLPAISVSSFAGPAAAAERKDLLVTFSGPFCYWVYQSAGQFKVMAPPVGTDYPIAPHQGWIGTSANETRLKSLSGNSPVEYHLKIDNAPQTPPAFSGTPAFSYEQSYPLGSNSLFNLMAPFPHLIVGTRPTRVDIQFKSGSKKAVPQNLASGLTFLYRNVDLSAVVLSQGVSGGGHANDNGCVFKPCFDNDKDLPLASLSINLTRLEQHPDKGHQHAKFVWSQMLTMYPWMLGEISGIEFFGFENNGCDGPNPCAFASGVGAPEYGPGNDCEVPIMLLSPGTKSAR